VLNELDSGHADHPVDIVERLAAHNQWSFERSGDDEIAIEVTGTWCSYNTSFTWVEEMESLHLACAFGLKVPEARRIEMLKLIAMINEQLWIGHFDLWPSEDVVMFRHSLLLAGCSDALPRQCEAILDIALRTAERYYQAFQFVVWAGKRAEEALAGTLFETVGRA